ncbi:hypothetical protein ONZ43_g4711 [Nemania bipapillata]|uniref:Uncharacterized protein n=1 Tax=Nemania bipapillata TaxID=110536 RepID=A0ACC2IJ98_9PEZI|nr:hypothetical protein ONZ43_g4711 [Nemania bipapillata]
MLVGLEAVKAYFRELGTYIDHSKIVNVNFAYERFHAIFQGNPGTGKTTVARLYAKFLQSKGVLQSSKVIETSGGKLASQRPNAVIKIFKSSERGMLFIDEAYQLVAPHSKNAGKQVLDVILSEMENQAGRWVVIFAGYKNDFEPFFAHNEGLSSRIPRILDFGDFNDEQLLLIMCSLFEKRFTDPKNRYKIEGGCKGVYMRAAIRRISQSRGRHGFGNARAVQNYFQRVCLRQASRVGQLNSPGIEERLYFTKEDILGPRPIDVRAKSKAWAKLKSLVGLNEVKRSVNVMFQILETNYQRELMGLRPHAHSLNRVFVGLPGTGKTTVGKLYGRILADLGFLSKGDVVIKTPADFIGDAVGRSESNTKTILASTIGKVLIIDEAYMLDPADSTGKRNSYKAAVLDIIVAEVQGNPGDDRCVILIGYEDNMRSLFYNGNPGLSGRFMADIPFRFEDYSDDELRQILEQDLKDRHLKYEQDALKSAIDMLSRYRITPNFSNARAAKTLVSEAVLRNQERQMKKPISDQLLDVCLEAQDFDPWLGEWAASSGAPINYKNDLSGLISDSVIEQLENILPGSQVPGHVNRDKVRQNFPRNFIFVGPPKSGKTTLANYMGLVFRRLGLLPTDQVVTCFAGSFIGQYVGQTVPKTQEQLARGLGKVLVIEDLHRLGKGGYSGEALDELTSFLSTNAGRMAVILTGPEEPLGDLLRVRPELSFFFQDRITFSNLSPDESLDLLEQYIREGEPHGVIPLFASGATKVKFRKAMSILTWCDRWANSDSVYSLAFHMLKIGDKERARRYHLEPGIQNKWILTEDMAMEGFKAMFDQMKSRGGRFVMPPAKNTSSGDSGGVASGPSMEAAKPESAVLEAEIESAAVSEREEYAKATTHSEQELAAPQVVIETEAVPEETVQVKQEDQA